MDREDCLQGPGMARKREEETVSPGIALISLHLPQPNWVRAGGASERASEIDIKRRERGPPLMSWTRLFDRARSESIVTRFGGHRSHVWSVCGDGRTVRHMGR